MEKYSLIFPNVSFQEIILDLIIGLISITIINLTALFGIIILPFRNKSTFKWILSTFIGLGRKDFFIVFGIYWECL